MTSAETRALHNTQRWLFVLAVGLLVLAVGLLVFVSDNTLDLESAVTVESRPFVRFGDANIKITSVVPLSTSSLWMWSDNQLGWVLNGAGSRFYLVVGGGGERGVEVFSLNLFPYLIIFLYFCSVSEIICLIVLDRVCEYIKYQMDQA